MVQTIRAHARSLTERIRAGLGRRAMGILLALLVEGILALALLTLTPKFSGKKEAPAIVFALDMVQDEPAEDERAAEESQSSEQTVPQPPEPIQTPPPEPQPAPPELPLIELSREEVAVAENAITPPPAPRPMMGPPAPAASPGDTPRVEGTGPNGEPLYAAAWYREPYDDELSGYLSTARGPGWGLIACRTVPDFRVEDCVALGEYPEGSNIARSVLAAAWQFRVRPPQIRGRSLVGEWVRIRIDYGLERRNARR